jgi:hypothetical protein
MSRVYLPVHSGSDHLQLSLRLTPLRIPVHKLSFAGVDDDPDVFLLTPADLIDEM